MARLPALDRERRRLPEADVVPSPPSSLDLNRRPSAARSGQAEIAEHLADHTETGPELTAGDVDASWESAYSTGDEAPGGDNPTPDQDIVDDIGRSLGLVYEDTEELKGADKITERDKHRWELDPASAEDFNETRIETERLCLSGRPIRATPRTGARRSVVRHSSCLADSDDREQPSTTLHWHARGVHQTCVRRDGQRRGGAGLIRPIARGQRRGDLGQRLG